MTFKEILKRVALPSSFGSDACWLWHGDSTAKGYGILPSPTGERTQRGKLRRIYAHRLFWELFNDKSIPDGFLVCHRCDVRNCVNPEHLFVGTPLENSADMKAKGRSTWGEKNPRAKLKESEVVEIKSLLKSGQSQASLGEKFGVSRGAIKEIHRGHNCKHVEVPV